MERSDYVELEHLTGVGGLYLATEKILDVDYDLRVFEEYLEPEIVTGSFMQAETETSVEGAVSTDNPHDIAALVDTGKIYTLHLEDGRKLSLSVVDGRGSIKPASGFH